MRKLTGRIRRLAARSTPSAIAPVRSKSPLLLSARFSAQSELNDFFDFFRLAVADKNGHNPSFFAKAFESGQFKTQTAHCRLQTGGKMQTEGKMQTADCRPGVKCRLRIK